MRPRAAFPLIALVVGAGISVVAPACTVPETKYGAPGALGTRAVPDPTSPGEGTGGGTFDLATLCDGKPPPAPDAACAVKWPTLFDKYVKAGGTWNCGNTQCHGGTNPAAVGPLVTTDAQTTWENFVKYKFSGKLYVNPCSKVPDESSLACNVSGGCLPVMPQAGAIAAPELAEVKTWLTCGGPAN